MKFRRLSDIDVRGKKVLIRADLNVPRGKDGAIGDDSRIRASMAGIADAVARGAAVMVTSHLGRPTEGSCAPEDSLAPVAARVAELAGRPVTLVTDWVGGGAWHASLAPGQIVMLENCRCNPGEKANDDTLARRMAALCDVYCNDAFATSHRAEATTHGIAKYAPIACAGPLMAAELDALGKAFAHPARPLIAIVGGAKVSTKLTILKSLAQKVDALIVGGGIANTFILAAGGKVGKSLCEPDLVGEAKAILDAWPMLVLLPVDAVCAKSFAADAEPTIKIIEDIADDDLILDAGPRSIAMQGLAVARAATIVWNGPIGVFEFEAFEAGTRAVAEAVASSSAFSVAGGGETVAAIQKFRVADRISYISTAGGAFLEFLEGRELPAVAILETRATS